MSKSSDKRRRRDLSRTAAQALSIATFTFTGVVLGVIGGTGVTPADVGNCAQGPW